MLELRDQPPRDFNGFHMPKLISLIGQKFGQLEVKAKAENSRGRTSWRCLCDCGNFIDVIGNSLRTGNTQSCGCLHKEQLSQRNYKHGLSKSPEHDIWRSMIQRCTNKNNKRYKDWGGRGISVCPRWMVFQNFYDDVGPRPSPKHSIDRFPNNNGNYEPGNVRWATAVQQAQNKRPRKPKISV